MPSEMTLIDSAAMLVAQLEASDPDEKAKLAKLAILSAQRTAYEEVRIAASFSGGKLSIEQITRGLRQIDARIAELEGGGG